jgi:hypothetical protein
MATGVEPRGLPHRRGRRSPRRAIPLGQNDEWVVQRGRYMSTSGDTITGVLRILPTIPSLLLPQKVRTYVILSTYLLIW